MSSIPVRVAAALISAELTALGIDADKITADWLASILGDAPHCNDCSRPIWAPSSVKAGRGPRCAAKRSRS